MNYNKVFGLLAIGLNCFIYLPWSFEIITAGGGSEGWGLLFLPLTFTFHLFCITGLIGFLNKEAFNHKAVKLCLVMIWFLLFLLALISIRWEKVIWVMIFLMLVVLTIHKRIRIECSVLLTNIFGSILMLVFKILFDL
jgi:hypothetical protein